jgi:enediyne biosynthesis protein E4
VKGFFFRVLFVLGIFGCSNEKDQGFFFEALPAEVTNVNFNNSLQPSKELNIMTYLYFYNGSGVGLGDFNKDGLSDIYFSSNLGKNQLYLNRGGMRFNEQTHAAGLDTLHGWSTGVSVVDINNDGFLDIYVNQVTGLLNFSGRNLLFLCQGIENGVPRFREAAADYGLDFRGLATQSMFFDYDLDGDLDLYQLNHSVHENGTFGERKNFLGKVHPTSGDKMYRNVDGRFIDATVEAGIQSTAIGYGLGVSAGDFNNDGWPDLYIGNDFHENDYLYINQQDGSFKEVINDQMTHTSRFSMGVDIADFNNDARDDVISLDMQPYDPVVLKSSLGEDDYGAFMFKLSYGYNVQFARNNLQLNNGDGTFSEIGMYAKVHATDWSWAPLFIDFDNDGLKDLFVSNGIPARMNDIDYVNFRNGNEDHRWKTQGNRMDIDDLEIIKKIPEIKFPNKFYGNSGKLMFEERTDIKGNAKSFSNGAAYGDLDNDGDLEIVVNNINDNAFIYKNNCNELKLPKSNYIGFKLVGSPKNVNGIGARVLVFAGTEILSTMNFPVRGFQSSVEHQNVIVGVGDSSRIDSVLVIWPDHRCQRIEKIRFNTKNSVTWNDSLPKFDFKKLARNQKAEILIDRTESTGLNFVHKENSFNEFDRERLIPFMVSTEGPAIAVGDLNGDSLDDVYFGGSKRERGYVYLQTRDGKFVDHTSSVIRRDSVYEDVDAILEDVDRDGDKDLVVASGGNEFWAPSDYLRPRIYINDGAGMFNKRIFVGDIRLNSAKVLALDVDGDGHVDLFFGARSEPRQYGVVPRSYLMRNMGSGLFEDITLKVSDSLAYAGLITGGAWADMDSDGDSDLTLSTEWNTLRVFINDNGRLIGRDVNSKTGLWTFVYPLDGDNDGDIDIIAGNAGLNTKFTVSESEPLKLYLNDFDDNGQVETILTSFVQGREIPFATHADLTKQLPFLKKRYLFARDFAEASLKELFGSKLSSAKKFEVTTLQNMYFENLGDLSFSAHALPTGLQFSTVRAASQIQSASNETTVLLAGNFVENNIDMGRYLSNYGNKLSISKGAALKASPSLGIKGQVRRIVPIRVGNRNCQLIVRNNGAASIIDFADSTTALQ